MKRFEKILLCGLLVCTLLAPAGLADGDAPAQIAETGEAGTAPAGDASVAPTKPSEAETSPAGSPESGETPAPTQLPEVEASPDASPEPGETPAPSQPPEVDASPDTSPEPGDTPAPSPSPDTSPEAGTTVDPSAEPGTEPEETPEPSQPPLPGSMDGLVHITPEGDGRQEGDVWRIQLSAPDAELAFSWTVDGEAKTYWIYVQSDGGNLRRIAETTQARIVLSAADYMTGQHTLYVGATLADDSITWGCIAFALVGQMGGRFPGGGRTGGSAGQFPQEEQGFHVTPGEALTDTHAPGDGNAAAYTCSEISASADPVTILQLDSTQTQITLDDGAAFHINEADGVLELIPESGGACWQLSALALRTLADSGIERVVFHLGEGSRTLSTRMEFCGSVYAALRAEGYVSKDMVLRVNQQGLRVEIEGKVYQLDDSGALLPDGE